MGNQKIHEKLSQMGIKGLIEVTNQGVARPLSVQHLEMDLEAMEEFFSRKKEKELEEAVSFIKKIDEIGKILYQVETKKYLLHIDFRKETANVVTRTNNQVKRITRPTDGKRVLELIRAIGGEEQALQIELVEKFSKEEAQQKIGDFLGKMNLDLFERYEVLSQYLWIEVGKIIQN